VRARTSKKAPALQGERASIKTIIVSRVLTNSIYPRPSP
jgi:hypothetical protein